MPKTTPTPRRRIIATCGIPASGKTTFALGEIDKDPDGVCRANRDALRVAHAGRRLGRPAQEAIVTAAQDEMIRAAFQYGYHTVIVDDTNLHGFSRLTALAAQLGADFEVKDFRQVPLTTCLKRNRIRPLSEQVPEDVICGMYDNRVLPYLRRLAAEAARVTA
jgi:tRNA uridine 5-carbamoylmethylation protein Kti12